MAARCIVVMVVAARLLAQQLPAALTVGEPLAADLAVDGAPWTFAVRSDAARGTLRCHATLADGCVELNLATAAGKQLGTATAQRVGGPAFLECDVDLPATLCVSVRRCVANEDEAAAAARVHVALQAETPATSAAAAAGEQACGIIEGLLTGAHQDFSAARTCLQDLDRTLGSLAGAAASPRIAALRARTIQPALHLGAFDIAAHGAEAWRAYCAASLPAEHEQLQRAIGDLAQVLRARGDFGAAHELMSGVVATFERTLPASHPFLGIARANLASLLTDVGELRGALPLQELVVEQFLRRWPDGHPQLWVAQQNLAATLTALGDLQRAKSMQERIVAAWSKVVADDDPELQTARLNLARTLSALGDLVGARILLEGVVAVRSRTLPSDHPLLQTARNNLAAVLRDVGEFEAAQRLQEQVVLVVTRTLPPEHPQRMTAVENYAATLAMRGQLAKAKALFALEVQQLERTFPADHGDLCSARLGLATVQARSGDNDAALATLRQARAATDGSMGPSDPIRTRLLGDLARLEAAAGADGVGLVPLLQPLCDGIETRLLQYGATLSPRECAAAVVQARTQLGTVLGLLPRCGDASLCVAAFRAVEAARGIEGAAQAVARGLVTVHGEGAAALVRERTALAVQSRRLADLARAGAAPTELARALHERDMLESSLRADTRRLLALGVALDPVTPASVAAQLDATDAVVALWTSRAADVPIYTAFTVAASGALQFVDLGPAAVIDAAIGNWRAALTRPDNEQDEAAGVRRAAARDLGDTLRRRLIDPLRAAVGGARRWFVCADGPLHLLPFDALPEADGRSVVGDAQAIVVTSSMRELRRGRAIDRGPPRLCLVGGLDYGRGTGNGEFASLPGTRRELEEIAACFAEQLADGVPVRLEDQSATAATLRTATVGARYVHLATHAWFAPDSVPSVLDPEPVDAALSWGQRSSLRELVRGLSPMLLCGLALSGANVGGEGILTGEELGTLDLSGCDLAVLSGCETALGLHRVGQGLASLQCALHVAGARAVIASLWSVPDRATRQLMAAFYRALWQDGLPPEQALWRAKQSLRAATTADGTPRFETGEWAAWVLSGTW